MARADLESQNVDRSKPEASAMIPHGEQTGRPTVPMEDPTDSLWKMQDISRLDDLTTLHA